MRHKDLKNFSRKELLEVLVSQGKEIERLEEELKLANEKLASREIYIKNSGSIAEAALRLNHIFEDADSAAQQYLASINKMVQMEYETLNRISQKEQVVQEQLDKLQGKNSD